MACPYGAIYMDPETNTADKCTYCAHRVEGGMMPACVTACPVEANIFGDLMIQKVIFLIILHTTKIMVEFRCENQKKALNLNTSM